MAGKETDNRPSDPNFANPTNAPDGGLPKSPDTEILNAREILFGIYGSEAIYPDTVRVGEGKGVMTVRQEHVGRKSELLFDSIDEDSNYASGQVQITDSHALGHFSPESGLPLVLPGHKHVRLAVEATRRLLAARFKTDQSRGRLFGFAEAVFSGAIRPGDSVDVVGKYLGDDGYLLHSDVSLFVNGDLKSTISGLILADEDEVPDDSMLPDQLIEFAAQSAATEIFAEQPDRRPIFQGIGKALFAPVNARINDRLTALVSSTSDDRRKFEGSSIIVNQHGDVLAQIDNMRGLIGSQSLVKRALGVK